MTQIASDPSQERKWVLQRAFLKGTPLIGSVFNGLEGPYNLCQSINHFAHGEPVLGKLRFQQGIVRTTYAINLTVCTLFPSPFLLSAMGYAINGEMTQLDVEDAVRKSLLVKAAGQTPENAAHGLGDIRGTGEDMGTQLFLQKSPGKLHPAVKDTLKTLIKVVPVVSGTYNLAQGVKHLGQMTAAFYRKDAQVAALRFRQAMWRFGFGIENLGFSAPLVDHLSPLLFGTRTNFSQIFGALPTGNSFAGAMGLLAYNCAAATGFDFVAQAIDRQVEQLEKIPNRATSEQNKISLKRLGETAVKALPFVGGLVIVGQGIKNLANAAGYYLKNQAQLGNMKLNQGLIRIGLAGYNLTFHDFKHSQFAMSTAYLVVDESDAQDIGHRVDRLAATRPSLESALPVEKPMFSNYNQQSLVSKWAHGLKDLITKPYQTPLNPSKTQR